MIRDITWTERTISSNGTALHVMMAGPEDGDPVVMLHGFPEFWYAWRHQIPALVAAGYWVIVPDQRGYNVSEKPHGVWKYHASELVGDVVGLLDALGCEKVNLVAHDWGGHVGWWTASAHPQRVSRLVLLNIAHPRVMRRAVLLDVRQTLKSWYVLLLQVPRLPEWLLSRKGYRLLLAGMARDRRTAEMSEEETAQYLAAWSRPRALRSMINWYRAEGRSFLRKPAVGRISVPTLLIWGESDQFLHRSLAEKSIAQCDHGRLVVLPDATHWVHHEKPDEVSTLILDFLNKDR